MAKVLVLGGGFGGVVAAERLAEQLGDEHQITLVSRSRQFIFYPGLVKLAFGKAETSDVSFDLRQTMLNRRVNFIEAEVAYIDPFERTITIAHGEVEGKLPYDYLVFALGRRLATERILGFYEHAHHLLNVGKAINFGKAVKSLHTGRAVFGQCFGARLPVPVYESAFALARRLEEKGERERVRITIVSPTTLDLELRDVAAAAAIKKALDARQIEFLPNLRIQSLTENSAITSGDAINFDLLMLVPPFRGSSAASYFGITNEEGYIHVDSTMRVASQERIYAVGDCTNFEGPKMGHMAVRQAEVAAANLAAEIEGRGPVARYQHKMRFVIDELGADSLYVHKDLSTDEPATVRQGRFWSWAKKAHEKYWEVSHS
ncbi:MAG TPA: FAD-dependent oxidoreductase [Pyrinomonadaceae bacterium]|jgi:sulfide:quinone oxidoreductase|nr:FAD-dependent oxidoreductase [Pyrinomonadaceae bacterium]